MAHFAILDENNLVTDIVRIDNDEMLNGDGVEVEQMGIDRCVALFGQGDYVQTSYNDNIRGKYAGIGDKYDSTLDKFIVMVAPAPSWTFDENTGEWVAPLEKPEGWNENDWNWDEEAYQADNTTGWTQNVPDND